DFEVLGQRIDDRVHGPAGRAPVGPEVHEHRLGGLQDFLLPVELVQEHGRSRQGRFGPPANLLRGPRPARKNRLTRFAPGIRVMIAPGADGRHQRPTGLTTMRDWLGRHWLTLTATAILVAAFGAGRSWYYQRYPYGYSHCCIDL